MSLYGDEIVYKNKIRYLYLMFLFIFLIPLLIAYKLAYEVKEKV